jgi:hypothetical protein
MRTSRPSRRTGRSMTLTSCRIFFGPIGRSWRETDEDAADRETMISDLLPGASSTTDPHRCLQHRCGMVR